MKKTILFPIILLLNCVFATQSTAYVFSKKGETAQIAPPQYQAPKMQAWQVKLLKRVAKMVKPAEEPTKLFRQAQASILLALLSVVIAVVVYSVLAVVGSAAFFLIGWLTSLLVGILSIIKGRGVLKNANATEKEKKLARTGTILGIVLSTLILLFPIVIIVALILSFG